MTVVKRIFSRREGPTLTSGPPVASRPWRSSEHEPPPISQAERVVWPPSLGLGGAPAGGRVGVRAGFRPAGLVHAARLGNVASCSGRFSLDR